MFSLFAPKPSSRRSNTREIRIGRSVETPGEISRDSDAIGSRRIKECCDAPFVSMLSITPTYRDDRRRHHRRFSFSSEVSVHSVFSLFSFFSFLLFFLSFFRRENDEQANRFDSIRLLSRLRDATAYFPHYAETMRRCKLVYAVALIIITITRTAATIAFTKSEKG